MTPSELADEIATLSAHLDAATHRLLECIRLFDESGEWCDQGALSCAHWLSWRVGLDPGTAREKVRVARALGKLPAMDEALRSARLSYAKVRALTRVATAENEGRLLELALVATAAQLERLCRGYRAATAPEEAPAPEERSVYRRSLPGGMVKVELVLEPDEADLFLRAVERAREVRRPSRRRAFPRKRAGRRGPMGRSGSPSRSWRAIRSRELEGSASRSWFISTRRCSLRTASGRPPWRTAPAFPRKRCEGSLVTAALLVVSGDGENLNVGRRTRSIPPAIRRALMARDRGCAFPGCTHTSFLHAHHIKHWLHGGETSLDNPVLLCTVHHHMVHEGGWTITRGADGALLFHPPRGKPLAQNPPQEPVDDALAWMHEWAEERGLDLGPEVNMPEWDGSRPDYALAVGGLLET